MNITETIATVGFWREGEKGSLRIGNTRVSLDSVYYRFTNGASAEEIVESFPALRLSEVYATIAYILENRDEVDEYIREGEIQTEKMRTMIDEKFGERNAQLKKKIIARNETRLNALKP